MLPPECLSCLGLDGSRRISPGPPIHIGEFWQVEHAYPSALLGWLVVVLRRHTVALHELTSEEFAEFGTVLEHTVRVLHHVLGPAKEYVACYAEQPGFEHIHFHVVPRAFNLPHEFRGAGSFAFLKAPQSEAVDPEAVRFLCESLQGAFAQSVPGAA